MSLMHVAGAIGFLVQQAGRVVCLSGNVRLKLTGMGRYRHGHSKDGRFVRGYFLILAGSAPFFALMLFALKVAVLFSIQFIEIQMMDLGDVAVVFADDDVGRIVGIEFRT